MKPQESESIEITKAGNGVVIRAPGGDYSLGPRMITAEDILIFRSAKEFSEFLVAWAGERMEDQPKVLASVG